MSLCPYVGLLVTTVYCGKMAVLNKMTFGVVGQVDSRNDVLDGFRIPLQKGHIWGQGKWGGTVYVSK